MEKVEQVAEHVNMVLRYIPYIQTNFVLGLDGDEGPDPFELTKTVPRPGRPERSRPIRCSRPSGGRRRCNLDYQRAGRVLPFPFHFLNNNHAMNVRPKNYHVAGVLRSPGGPDPVFVLLEDDRPAVRGDPGPIPRWMNFIRAISSEGFGRIKYHTRLRAGWIPTRNSAATSRERPPSCRRSTATGSGRSSAPCTSSSRRARGTRSLRLAQDPDAGVGGPEARPGPPGGTARGRRRSASSGSRNGDSLADGRTGGRADGQTGGVGGCHSAFSWGNVYAVALFFWWNLAPDP